MWQKAVSQDNALDETKFGQTMRGFSKKFLLVRQLTAIDIRFDQHRSSYQ
jgi:hypothetical protein